MGLKHSSYVADLTFARLGDSWATRREVMLAFGIVYYRRFRDDLFILSRKPEQMWRFFFCLRARISRAFRIEVTELSSRMVTMLAVQVEICGQQFVCRPRPRACHVPLTWDSSHPSTVHRWWPVGHILGLRRLCTRKSEYISAVGAFLDRLLRFHTPTVFVDWLRAFVKSFEQRSNSSRRAVSISDVWMVLDWHSSHEHRDVSRAIHKFLSLPETGQTMRFLFARPPSISLAWRVVGRKLVALTRPKAERMEVGAVADGERRSG